MSVKLVLIVILHATYVFGLYERLLSYEGTTAPSKIFCRTSFGIPGFCSTLSRCYSLSQSTRIPKIPYPVIFGSSSCSHRLNPFIVCCPLFIMGHNEDQTQAPTTTEIDPTIISPTTLPTSTTSDSSIKTTTSPMINPALNETLYAPKCGFSNSTLQRVVGGSDAALGAWPWMAALGYKVQENFVTIECDGTLISSRHVITAAHCVYNRNNLYLVRLGDYDLYNNDDGAEPMNYLVEKFAMHPNFLEATSQNDIAIVKLKNEVIFTDFIRPICLPLLETLKHNNYVGNYGFLAGWGAMKYGGDTSNVLQEVSLPIVPNAQCKQSFQHVINVNITDNVLCAGFKEGGKDACQGDSGGPLMYFDNGFYYIIGIVSTGYQCAKPNYPGVYTRVTSYLDFILSNLN